MLTFCPNGFYNLSDVILYHSDFKLHYVGGSKMNETIQRSKDIIYDGNDEILFKRIEVTKKFLREIGIPANFIGYKYIGEALLYMLQNKQVTFVNEIYRNLSKYHNTSSNSVEVSINNAIKRALEISEENVRKILKISDSVKITNSVFLNTAKEIIYEEVIKEA